MVTSAWPLYFGTHPAENGAPHSSERHRGTASQSVINKRERHRSFLAKRPRSDGQNGPRQPECCKVPTQKIWWCYCRPACLAQNASLHVPQHNSKPSFLMAGVTALCVSRRQPTRQVSLSFNSPYKRANFRDDFFVYDHTTGKALVLV